MRIGFIILDSNPTREFSDNLLEYQCDAVHLGIGYISAFAQKNVAHCECQVLRTSNSSLSDILKFLDFGWDLIGMTSSLFSLHEAANISSIAKKIGKSKIVIGGPEVSTLQENILDVCPSIDYAIYGEGEITFVELISCIKHRDNFEKVDGLIFRNEYGVIIKNVPRRFEDNLEIFPYPDRQIFTYEHAYHSIIGTRGCPFRCSFCNSAQIWGNKYRMRKPISVIKEIEYILKFYGKEKLFIFQDDTFNFNEKWTIDICNMIKELKITWRIRGIRASLITEKIAEILAESGCVGIACGVESANDSSLRIMNKKTTIDGIVKGVNMLKNKGIHVVGNFMIGNLGDTFDTVKQSLEYAHMFTQADFRITYPMKNTYLYDYLTTNNLFLPDPIPIIYKESIVGRILFATPEFSVAERIEAITLALKAKLLHNVEYD
ncbi:MAG: radical SAM protein [Chlorobiales bacterium]|nr:radical SAM protein [Chlorobiales bacterium]